MIKKILVLFLLFPSVCLATPSITSVTGTLDDGQTGITIAGSGFGTVSLDVDWLGPNIDEGVDNERFTGVPGWATQTVDSTTTYVVRYDNAQSHSGNNSLYGHWDGPNKHYVSYIYGDNGSTLDYGECIYVTYWVRFTYSGASGQWKWFRLRPNSSVNDTAPEIMASSWPLGEKYMLNKPVVSGTFNWTTDEGEFGNSSNGGIYFTTSPYTNSSTLVPSAYGTWRRVEFYACPSEQGATNGTFKYSIHSPGDYAVKDVVDLDGNLMTYGASQTGRWRYVIIGHYWGNATSTTEAHFWVDDIYKQNTQARIEIGDNATFANCTHREIQYPTSWADTSIQFTCNHGSFVEDDTAYVFVIDSDGVASAGEEITIGGTGGSDTTPATFPTSGPTGAQTCTSDPRNVTLECTTNENATVKYDTSDTTYDLMANTFSTTGEMSHSTVVSNACDAAYTYYVRSMDAAGNKNTSSETISYTVAAEAVDTINPTIEITYPATNPYDQDSQYIRVEGNAGDDILLSTVSAECPICQLVSAVMGTTNWYVDLVLSQGTLGSDLLFGEGDFAATGNWSVGTYWSIAEGVATNDGTGGNSWLSRDAAVEVGETYRLYYDVTAYTSGNLYISQYGFGGSTVQLSNEVGSHTLDVTCTQDAELGIVSVYWIGSIDNVMLKKNQRNLLTMTATDSSSNTATDTVEIGYTPPSTTPTRVLGVGSYYNIDLGGGTILEIQ